MILFCASDTCTNLATYSVPTATGKPSVVSLCEPCYLAVKAFMQEGS